MSDKKTTIVGGIFFTLLAAFFAFGFFYVTVIPHFQGKEYIHVTDTGTRQEILDDTSVFSPDSNAQNLIRTNLLSAVFAAYNNGQLMASDPILDFAIQKMQDYVAKHPHYYGDYLALAKAYDVAAALRNDPSLYVTAEGYYKQALAIIPGRQEVVYAYALNLLHQNRPADAIALLDTALAQEPQIPDTHYELGQALVVQGVSDYDAALDQFEFALSRGSNLDPSLTLNAYRKFIVYYYSQGDLARFTTVVKRLSVIDPTQDAGYAAILNYIAKNGTMPAVNLQQQ